MQEGPRKKISLDDVSRIVWTRCFGVRFDEKALIITDKQREEIAQSLLGIGKELCKCQIVTIDGMKMDPEECTEEIDRTGGEININMVLGLKRIIMRHPEEYQEELHWPLFTEEERQNLLRDHVLQFRKHRG